MKKRLLSIIFNIASLCIIGASVAFAVITFKIVTSDPVAAELSPTDLKTINKVGLDEILDAINKRKTLTLSQIKEQDQDTKNPFLQPEIEE
jgi:hypothetical protein